MVVNSVEYYNDIYTQNPTKWASDQSRNFVAYQILNKLGVPDSLMDFGCGNGHTLEFFKDRWPDAKLVGVDISDVALDLARQRVPDGKFYQTMPDEKWDVITIMGVAEHFPHVSSELERIAEHLEPGGHIYLEVPNCLAYSDDKSEGFRETFYGAGQTEWHWKRETWNRAIQKAGLSFSLYFWCPDPTWQFIWVLKQ